MESRRRVLRWSSWFMSVQPEDTRNAAISAIAGIALIWVLAACSSQPSQPAVAGQPQSVPATGAVKSVAAFNPAGKTPEQLATYIFENHGCKDRHTLGKGGKLGFTAHGT